MQAPQSLAFEPACMSCRASSMLRLFHQWCVCFINGVFVSSMVCLFPTETTVQPITISILYLVIFMQCAKPLPCQVRLRESGTNNRRVKTNVPSSVMASPVKSLSFREDADGTVCIHQKVKPGVYKSISDFNFRMLNLVKFEGHLNNLSGYIFEICKSLGESQISK